MATAPTYQDLFEAGVRELLTKPTRFNAAIARDEGSDVNVALAFCAAMADESVRYSQRAHAENALATAAKIGGEVLDRFVYDRYGLIRRDAMAAVVPLRLQRSTIATGALVEAGSQFSTSDGVVFSTVTDVVFPMGSAGPFTVFATCSQTGPVGNVAVNTITTIISRLEDQSIIVTNPEAAAGGLDEESNSDLASRAQRFFPNAQKGTLSAIENGAVDGTGATRVQVIENLDPQTGNPMYRGQLIIADDLGQANAALADRVRIKMADYRCMGVPLTIIAGLPQYINIEITGLLFRAGAITTTVLNAARDAVVGAVNSMRPGQTLEIAIITAALKSITDLIVPNGSVVTPAGDLVPDPGKVIRTSKQLVTMNGL